MAGQVGKLAEQPKQSQPNTGSRLHESPCTLSTYLWTHGNARHGPVRYSILAVPDETGPGPVLVRAPPGAVGRVDDMKPALSFDQDLYSVSSFDAFNLREIVSVRQKSGYVQFYPFVSPIAQPNVGEIL